MMCCKVRAKERKLKHGSIVSGDDVLSDLKTSFGSQSENGKWVIHLSDSVKNCDISASSPEEAFRLAQWYAYLDYKELKSNKSNE